MKDISLLNELFEKYPSDKKEHGYVDFYAQYLPNRCPLLLELGAAKGYSALIWNEFYGKDNVDIHLLDLYLDKDHVTPRWVRNQGFWPLIGDQSDIGFLSTIPYRYNVIIDDASHRADHMLISFKALFHNNLISGGQYWIEDIACNFQEFYWGGEVHSLNDTPIAMFREYNKTGKIINCYFNEGESEAFQNMIDKVEILCDEKLILITRK